MSVLECEVVHISTIFLAYFHRLTLGPLSGSFRPGQSGNPSGRPKDVLGITKLARENSAEGIEKLIVMMQSDKLPPNIVLAAIAQLLDRGLGKPMQPTTMQHLGEDGQPTNPTYVLEVTGYDEVEAPPAPKTNGRAADASH